jgi:hypothetical protein
MLWLLAWPLPALAKDTIAEACNLARTQASVEAMGTMLDLSFDIPFPSQLDVDERYKTPLAKFTTVQGQLFLAKPSVNTEDGDGTVEVRLGLPDIKLFSADLWHFYFSFDDQGDLLHLGIMSDENWFRGTNGETHQIIRKQSETSEAFWNRVSLEFHHRAVSSSDPPAAFLYSSAVEKIVRTVSDLRKAQEKRPLPTLARP